MEYARLDGKAYAISNDHQIMITGPATFVGFGDDIQLRKGDTLTLRFNALMAGQSVKIKYGGTITTFFKLGA
jgi:hypothetical protein